MTSALIVLAGLGAVYWFALDRPHIAHHQCERHGHSPRRLLGLVITGLAVARLHEFEHFLLVGGMVLMGLILALFFVRRHRREMRQRPRLNSPGSEVGQ